MWNERINFKVGSCRYVVVRSSNIIWKFLSLVIFVCNMLCISLVYWVFEINLKICVVDYCFIIVINLF